MNILPHKYVKTVFWVAKCYSLLQSHLKHCDFLNIDISQGSVATYLRCGGIFKYQFVANLPMTLPVKEFWKSVNIWGSYGQEFTVLFFLTHSVVHYTSWDQQLKYITGHKVKMSCNTKKGIPRSKWAKTTRWWDRVSIYPPRFTGNNFLLLCDKYNKLAERYARWCSHWELNLHQCHASIMPYYRQCIKGQSAQN